LIFFSIDFDSFEKMIVDNVNRGIVIKRAKVNFNDSIKSTIILQKHMIDYLTRFTIFPLTASLAD